MYLVENGLALSGGQTVSTGESDTTRSQTIELHTQIVLKHLQRIASLERTRAALLALAPPDEADEETYDAWIAAKRSDPSRGSSSSGSSSGAP
jgi:hypothetical protein